MKEAKQGLCGRLLDRLAVTWLARHQPESPWRTLARRLQRAIIGLNVMTLVMVVLGMAMIEWVGERHWLTAYFLYIPRQAWIFPPLLLAPLVFWAKARLLWLNLLVIGSVLGLHMGFHWSLSPSRNQGFLTAMTTNIGQNNGQGFTAFLREQKPDLVALQDAAARGGKYAASYPEYTMAARGEFVLLSRWPIKTNAFVEVRDDNRQPIAAWFAVETPETTFIVYNVHLPSPRSELARSKGLGMLAALAGTGQSSSRTGRYRQTLDDAWNQRLRLARELHAILSQETRPFIVAGDFNMPARGYLHRLFRGTLTDAFAETGRGYGFTLPGSTRNPLSAFGPWMRIDYLFAGRGFTPVYCEVAPDRKSQHCPVAARFALAL